MGDHATLDSGSSRPSRPGNPPFHFRFFAPTVATKPAISTPKAAFFAHIGAQATVGGDAQGHRSGATETSWADARADDPHNSDQNPPRGRSGQKRRRSGSKTSADTPATIPTLTPKSISICLSNQRCKRWGKSRAGRPVNFEGEFGAILRRLTWRNHAPGSLGDCGRQREPQHLERVFRLDGPIQPDTPISGQAI